MDDFKLKRSKGNCDGCYFNVSSNICSIVGHSEEFKRKYNCTQNDEAYIIVKSLVDILKKL